MAVAIVPDDDVLPLRSLRLVGRNRPTEGRLSQMALVPPVAVMAVSVVGDVVFKMPFVDAQAAWMPVAIQRPDTMPVFVCHGGGKIQAALVGDILKRNKHPVDQPEAVLVFEADDFFGFAGGQPGAAQTGGGTHGVVELQPCGMHTANQLAAIECLFRRNIAFAELGHVSVIGAEADGLTTACHGRQTNDGALGRLAVDFGQHDIGGFVGKSAFAINGRQLAWIAENKDRLTKTHEIACHVFADHGDLIEHDQPGIGSIAMRV